MLFEEAYDYDPGETRSTGSHSELTKLANNMQAHIRTQTHTHCMRARLNVCVNVLRVRTTHDHNPPTSLFLRMTGFNCFSF